MWDGSFDIGEETGVADDGTQRWRLAPLFGLKSIRFPASDAGSLSHSILFHQLYL
jgi:hypothetical protein